MRAVGRTLGISEAASRFSLAGVVCRVSTPTSEGYLPISGIKKAAD